MNESQKYSSCDQTQQNLPEKIRLRIELEVDPLEVDVKLRYPDVGHADGNSQEVGVLAEVERWGQHCRAGHRYPSHSHSGRELTTQILQETSTRRNSFGESQLFRFKTEVLVRVRGSPALRLSPWRRDAVGEETKKESGEWGFVHRN